MTKRKNNSSGGSRISRRGRGPRRGAWTPEAVTFQKFCLSKPKNLDPLGVCRARPLDPSMNPHLKVPSMIIIECRLVV